MATGQVLFHRFFYSKSFVKHSFEVSPAGADGEREGISSSETGGGGDCFSSQLPSQGGVSLAFVLRSRSPRSGHPETVFQKPEHGSGAHVPS